MCKDRCLRKTISSKGFTKTKSSRIKKQEFLYNKQIKTKNKKQMCFRVAVFRGHEDEKNSMLMTKLFAGFESVSQLLSEGECSLRTVSNLDNLHVVRGLLSPKNGRLLLETSMTGPHHYFGCLDPHMWHKIMVTLKDNDYFVVAKTTSPKTSSRICPDLPTIFTIGLQPKIDFQWIAHNLPSDPKKSLFAQPGTFSILKQFCNIPTVANPQDYDWRTFRAQLVAPQEAFAFAPSTHAAAQHKVRLLTYYYGRDYFSQFCVPQQSDFLEHHEFVQFIHALSETSRGYMVLGRVASSGELQLVKFRIPFGYTLVLNAGCIHGDARLVGLYLMGMTGNHDAMRTANTVFLRNATVEQGFIEPAIGSFEPLMTYSACDETMLHARFADTCRTIQKNVNQERPLSAFFWQPAFIDGFGMYKKTQKYRHWVAWQQRAGSTQMLDSLVCGFV